MLFLGLCAGVGRSDRKRGEEGLVRENDEDGLLMPVRCKPWKVSLRQRLRRDHESCRLRNMLKTKTLLLLLPSSCPALLCHCDISQAIHTSPHQPSILVLPTSISLLHVSQPPFTAGFTAPTYQLSSFPSCAPLSRRYTISIRNRNPDRSIPCATATNMQRRMDISAHTYTICQSFGRGYGTGYVPSMMKPSCPLSACRAFLSAWPS